jgi:hypothetical protein
MGSGERTQGRGALGLVPNFPQLRATGDSINASVPPISRMRDVRNKSALERALCIFSIK